MTTYKVEHRNLESIEITPSLEFSYHPKFHEVLLAPKEMDEKARVRNLRHLVIHSTEPDKTATIIYLDVRDVYGVLDYFHRLVNKIERILDKQC